MLNTSGNQGLIVSELCCVRLRFFSVRSSRVRNACVRPDGPEWFDQIPKTVTNATKTRKEAKIHRLYRYQLLKPKFHRHGSWEKFKNAKFCTSYNPEMGREREKAKGNWKNVKSESLSETEMKDFLQSSLYFVASGKDKLCIALKSFLSEFKMW